MCFVNLWPKSLWKSSWNRFHRTFVLSRMDSRITRPLLWIYIQSVSNTQKIGYSFFVRLICRQFFFCFFFSLIEIIFRVILSVVNWCDRQYWSSELDIRKMWLHGMNVDIQPAAVQCSVLIILYTADIYTRLSIDFSSGISFDSGCEAQSTFNSFSGTCAIFQCNFCQRDFLICV